MPGSLQRLVILVVTGLAPFATTSLQARGCPMSHWQVFQGVELYRDPQSGNYFFASDRVSVDADGAPNAYHPDDIDKPCGATGIGLDCPENAGYPNKKMWPSVLVPDPSNRSKAYVQEHGPFKGFFVSKTAFFNKNNATEHDTNRYLDAKLVPYFVFPRQFYNMRGTGRLGDIGVAYHVELKTHTFFVVGDIGPSHSLGEASIAFHEKLGQQPVNPRNSFGAPTGNIAYVIFPYSIEEYSPVWPYTYDQLMKVGQKFLEKLGGLSVVVQCAQDSLK